MVMKNWHNDWFLRNHPRRKSSNNFNSENSVSDSKVLDLSGKHKTSDADILEELRNAAIEIMKSSMTPAKKLSKVQPIVQLLQKTISAADTDTDRNRNGWNQLRDMLKQ